MKAEELSLAPIRALAAFLLALSMAGRVNAQHLETFPFNGPDGRTPLGGLVSDATGNLYGTTGGGGIAGIVFEMIAPSTTSQNWTEAVLYNFTGDGKNGAACTPVGNLIFDKTGSLYGVTVCGGLFNLGTVFELSPPPSPGGAWTETELYSFGQSEGDGAYPGAGLVFDQMGNLYGVTEDGGLGPGTVFELSPPSQPGGNWTETVLYTFAGVNDMDGANPQCILIRDQTGNLYGTTQFGGRYNRGTTFQLTPPTSPGGTWNEVILHHFYGPDGAQPMAGLVLGESGALLGTTVFGGSSNDGVAFQLRPPASPGGPWIEVIPHNFVGGGDGAGPNGLTFGNPSTLYGTTGGGGASNAGTIFQISDFDGSVTYAQLYNFTGGKDGSSPPSGSVIVGRGPALYGTTENGGLSGDGTVFRLAP